jgi:aryl-alcohol dehydrogenase-like predicted oxidoreductase
MKYNLLGKTGLKVSEVGFGTAPIGIKDYNEVWEPTSEQSIRCCGEALNTALDLGINLIDTAPMYGEGVAEEIIARSISQRRSEYILTTKLTPPSEGWGHLSVKYIEKELKKSLGRLQTNYIDLYQLHGDTWSAAEASMVLNSEAMACLGDLKKNGVIRYIGVTSESPQSVVPFIKSGLFDVVQIKYNIIYQEAYHQVLPLTADLGIGVLVMRPLTSGIFSKTIEAFCENDTVANLHEAALKYVLSDSRVNCAIVGMRRKTEVEQNVSLSEHYDKRVDLDWLHSRKAENNGL